MHTYNSLQKRNLLCAPENYDRHCSLLSGPLASELSTTYGVNFCSPLNQIDYFHVANNQIPQDIMHVLFEGMIPLETKLLLGTFINDKNYFIWWPVSAIPTSIFHLPASDF